MPQSSVASAKISRPKLVAALPRQRLFETLDDLRHYPILWIGGCPGAGKTTLVAGYLEERQLPALWYRVDREDHDAQALFDQLSTAGGAKPRAAIKPNRRLTHELYSRLPQAGVLVLDDCHEVAPDASIHALLVDSASEIPPGFNVVLIGRGEPPSLYSRLIANGTMGIIDSRELQFTLDETRALAARFSANEGAAQLLHAQCAGWAAGVAMTLDRLRRHASDARPMAEEMRKAAFGYFSGEVFDRASSEERRILVATALLPRVSGPTAKELSGSPQAEQLLKKLESRQLFTTRSAGTSSVYEYAPLFREFLLSRVEETLAPGDFKDMVNRAGCLLEECSELAAVVALIVRSRNWEPLLRLIFHHGMRLVAQGHAAAVRQWMDEVPADVHANEPWLTYLSGVASIDDDPAAARQLLETAWDRFEARADRMGQLLVAAAMLESHQKAWSSLAPIEVWIDRLQVCLRAVYTIPTHETELRIYADLLFALAWVRPASELMPTCISKLRSLIDSDVDINHRVLGARSLLVAHCSRFDANAARQVTRQLQSMLQEPGCSAATRVAALNAAGYGLWFEGAYPGAEGMLREVATTAKDRHLDAPEPLHFKTRHLLAFAQRDRNEMAECIHAMRQVIKSDDDLGLAMLSQALAEQASLRGDMSAAATHWSTAVVQADKAREPSMQWISRLALSACRASSSDFAGAGDLLQQAAALFEGAPSAALLRDHQLLTAYVALRRDDRIECHRLLAAALETERFTDVASLAFTVLPSAMAELCMEAVRSGIAAESVRILIQRYRLPPPPTADCDWPWPFKVFVLGTFRLLKDDAPLRFSRRMQKRTLELLQALIAFGGREVSAGALTDALWPDSDGDAAYHALESGLYRLRQLLGAPAAVIMAGGKLSLDRSYFWVDMWAFEKELHVSGAARVDVPARLARIRQLYAGHFLAHESDKSWAIETRHALRDKFLRSIRDAARAYESQRLWHEAVNVYQTGIELDKISEDLYRGLMICHRELGDHSEVLQVYRRCRELLSRMLGVQPNPKTQAIYQSVRQNPVAEST
jgi:LuxR family transcriptional regulator, maltose regulon positive regulatory protein